jgi:general nucleoside transport system permease protein
MLKNGKSSLVSLIAIALGFLLGSAILLCTGRDPLIMFNSLIYGFSGLNIAGGFTFNSRLIGEFFIQVMPIALTGLSVGFAFRTGLFNIGAEGQLMMGALGASVVALFVKAPAPIHIPLALLAALLFGAAWGAIPGFLKARFNIHEVVVTIMLNYTALYFSNFCLLYLLGTTDRVKTNAFPQSVLLQDGFLSRLTNGSRLNWGLIPVALVVFLSWFIINKTSLGYELRAVGFNKNAALASGMKVKRDVVLSMSIAGAYAGLAGAVICLGTFGLGRVLPSFEGYGMDGIAVALVGANDALGILFSSMLFGMLKAAGPAMQSNRIPKEIGSIISSSIVLFIAMRLGIEYLLDLSKRRKGQEKDKALSPVPSGQGEAR